MTAADVINALAAKYRAPEYAFLTEVRNSVGFSAKVRTADAMAMSLWPSRGLYMTGFEVKVSRADWKKELEQPEKAEELARFCKMWFVACPDKMIDKDEVPPGWGLIHVKSDGGLKYAKPAPEHACAEPTWMFFASLMRDVVENWVPKTLVDQRIEVTVKERIERLKHNEGYELKEAKRQMEKMRENIAAFEAESGIKIDRYSDYFNKEIGAAVAAFRRWHGVPHEELRQIAERVNRLSQEINTVAIEIKSLEQHVVPAPSPAAPTGGAA
jgi:hypothetical protein